MSHIEPLLIKVNIFFFEIISSFDNLQKAIHEVYQCYEDDRMHGCVFGLIFSVLCFFFVRLFKDCAEIVNG